MVDELDTIIAASDDIDDSVTKSTARRRVSQNVLEFARRSLTEAPFAGHALFARADAPAPVATLLEFQQFASVDLHFGICDERSKNLGMPSNVFVDSMFASVMALIENNSK